MDEYPSQLFDMLAAASRRAGRTPEVVVLTPGIYNSAYFEHSYLAQQMGANWSRGAEHLEVDDDDCVYMRTIEGLARVDVIYLAVDDLFLDPEAFDSSSLLGGRTRTDARLEGGQGGAGRNAPARASPSDKVVYTYVPEIIRYYLAEGSHPAQRAHLPLREATERAHVIADLEHLVVKPANESGGYGMLMGPDSTREERADFAATIEKRSAQLHRPATC